MLVSYNSSFFFFFNDTATTEIYTLSLHDALPISGDPGPTRRRGRSPARAGCPRAARRSEEHTSELQSHVNLVCRLLLERKKKNKLERVHQSKEEKKCSYDHAPSMHRLAYPHQSLQ